MATGKKFVFAAPATPKTANASQQAKLTTEPQRFFFSSFCRIVILQFEHSYHPSVNVRMNLFLRLSLL
ncbi:MAG: hypothetical protein PF795_05325 [Kiritimatiellae bacterium]|nr:hypothetical protein [Kiritimatiellia bacterium]